MWDVGMTATADDGLSLVGTLTPPAGPGPHPAVLLPPGSGRQDRDANSGRSDSGRPSVRSCLRLLRQRIDADRSRRWPAGSPSGSSGVQEIRPVERADSS